MVDEWMCGTRFALAESRFALAPLAGELLANGGRGRLAQPVARVRVSGCVRAASHWLRSPEDCWAMVDAVGSLRKVARGSGCVRAASHWLRSPRGLVSVVNGSVGSLSQWHEDCWAMVDVVGSLSQWHV